MKHMNRMKKHRSKWNFISMMPVCDVIMLIILYSAIIISALVAVITLFVYPISEDLRVKCELMSLDYGRLKNLMDMTGLAKGKDTVEIGERIKCIQKNSYCDTASAALIEKLQSLKRTSSTLVETDALLREQTKNCSSGFMKIWTDQQTDFWQRRIEKLCEKPQRELRLNEIRFDDSPNGYIEAFIELGNYYCLVLDLYDKCTEERVEVIDENLLRFKFDRYDEFDMDPQDLKCAKEKIKQLVDRYGSYRKIQIRGHCDQRGGDEYNYLLSFRRALYVGNVIKIHLKKQGLIEGKDYFISLIGFGKSRLLPKAEGEEEEHYYSRCRRIELAFQRLSTRD
ncbi:MAG: OmpA family protein [bacterium]